MLYGEGFRLLKDEQPALKKVLFKNYGIGTRYR